MVSFRIKVGVRIKVRAKGSVTDWASIRLGPWLGLGVVIGLGLGLVYG
jgi:hypothetical protein